MSAWLWVLIVVIVALVLLAAVYSIGARTRRRRSDSLQRQFGPEYDRTLEQVGDRATAEDELLARQRQHDELELHALTPAARESFVAAWQATQAEFVDNPARAIRDADQLIQTVMRARGYPVEEFEERASIVSVDHPLVVERYRRAHAVSIANTDGNAGTEKLRQAVKDYRALFAELVEDDPARDESLSESPR